MSPTPWAKVWSSAKAVQVLRQFAPADLVDQLRHTVSSGQYRSFIEQSGRTHRSGIRRIPLAIDRDAIIDVGASTPIDSNTVAVVDLRRSPKLSRIIKRKLRLDPSKETVHAYLWSSFRGQIRKGTTTHQYRHQQQLIVTFARDDGSRVGAWTLRAGRWTRLFDQGMRKQGKRHAVASGTSYYGAFKSVALSTGDKGRYGELETPTQEDDEAEEDDRRRGPGPDLERRDVKKWWDYWNEQNEDEPTQDAPATYTTYGDPNHPDNATCSGYCNAVECTACCAKQSADQTIVIADNAAHCHAVANGGGLGAPFMHVACDVVMAAQLTGALGSQAKCTYGCTQSFESTNSCHN